MADSIHGNERVRDDIAAAMREAPTMPAPAHDERIIRSKIDEPLADHFAERAEEAGMHVARITREALSDRISSLLQSAGAGPILLEPALAKERPELGQLAGCVMSPTEEELFSAAAGIVSAEAGIAETGTIVRSGGPDRPRGFALAPMVVIVILPESRIVADLYDRLTEQDPLRMPSELVLITGPSKTADIGMKLVTGIHGPGVVHVVMIEDA